MLRKLQVRRFKSLANVSIALPRFSVLFGVNAAGKSNILDAVHTLSMIGTQRTLMDALGGPMTRGYPIEAFTLPENGVAGLVSRPDASFSLEADLEIDGANGGSSSNFRYRVGTSDPDLFVVAIDGNCTSFAETRSRILNAARSELHILSWPPVQIRTWNAGFLLIRTRSSRLWDSAARGESRAAFERPCIPSSIVAPRSHMAPICSLTAPCWTGA